MSQNKDTSQSQRTRYFKDRVNFSAYVLNQTMVTEGRSQFPKEIEGGTGALTPHQYAVANLKAGAVFTTAAEYDALVVSTYTVPGAPTGVTGSSSTTDGAANVSWTAPAFTGYTTILRYTITSSPATTPVTVTGSTTSVVYTGLTPLTSYTFTVVATNIVGSGPASAASGAVTPPIPLSVTFLLVGGGGGGGAGNGGGGGGAGGVLSGPLAITQTSTAYTVTVGATKSSGTRQDTQDGYSGDNTTLAGSGITTQTAIGGGGGGGWNISGTYPNAPPGGSGGGAGGSGAGKVQLGGIGIAGPPVQGYNGGKNGPSIKYNAGGGGGGGGVGGDGTSTTCGSGGVGTSAYSALLSTITGAGVSVGVNSGGTYYIAGGGAGCGEAGSPTNYGQGGLGGGGGGVNGTGGISGTANTGGGGGAQGTAGISNGGSGLAIIYYTSPTQLGTGGTVASVGSGATKIWYHVFKTTGANTFTF